MKAYCYICGSNNGQRILSKPATQIWTNATDRALTKQVYECIIDQCLVCGHVSQPMTDELRVALGNIYQSENAQLSTPFGEGNWGKRRAQFFSEHLGLGLGRSVLEIGSGSGYMLSYLKSIGFTRVVGIEPSFGKSEQVDGIQFIKAFASKYLKLEEKFDLIIALGVFEHIEDINSTVEFCRNHLNDGAQLLFSVPNSSERLNSGDPSLFVHEHIHHFTPDSIVNLLTRNGMVLYDFSANYDVIIVKAHLGKGKRESVSIKNYQEYGQKVNCNLLKIQSDINSLRDSKCDFVFHGVNSALNNLLNWNGIEAGFILADNDEKKQGQFFWSSRVFAVSELKLKNISGVFITTFNFSREIKFDYRRFGFSGPIFDLVIL